MKQPFAKLILDGKKDFGTYPVIDICYHRYPVGIPAIISINLYPKEPKSKKVHFYWDFDGKHYNEHKNIELVLLK